MFYYIDIHFFSFFQIDEYYIKLADRRASNGLIHLDNYQYSQSVKQKLIEHNIGVQRIQGELVVRLELPNGCGIYKYAPNKGKAVGVQAGVYVILCTKDIKHPKPIISWTYSGNVISINRSPSFDDSVELIPVKMRPLDTHGKWYHLKQTGLFIYEKVPGVNILCCCRNGKPMCDIGISPTTGSIMLRKRECFNAYYIKYILIDDRKYIGHGKYDHRKCSFSYLVDLDIKLNKHKQNRIIMMQVSNL